MEFLDDRRRQFALAQRVAHLATSDASGTPHVVPICFALLDQTFYFVIDEKPKKSRLGLKRLRNLAENPRVALVFDFYSDTWEQLAYLLVHGDGRLVERQDEYDQALTALRDRYPQYHSMPIRRDTHPMVRITIRRAHFWEAAHASSSATLRS